MIPEQKTTYINAQIELMSAEKEMMIVENKEREAQGLPYAHGSKQWQEFLDRWESVIGHNAIVELFIHQY